jgi:hypothetical protein
VRHAGRPCCGQAAQQHMASVEDSRAAARNPLWAPPSAACLLPRAQQSCLDTPGAKRTFRASVSCGSRPARRHSQRCRLPRADQRHRIIDSAECCHGHGPRPRHYGLDYSRRINRGLWRRRLHQEAASPARLGGSRQCGPTGHGRRGEAATIMLAMRRARPQRADLSPGQALQSLWKAWAQCPILPQRPPV